MDLVQLRYFLRVAELRSFGKAADALHIAQPAITRQIRLLERELDVTLFHRHSRGSEPTEAGVMLKAGAEKILRLTEQVRAEVISRALVPTGPVRIGFPPSVGNLLIGAVVSQYRKSYPDILISLMEGYNQILQGWLMSDRIDIAIMTQFEGHPLLESQFLYDESLWLLGPCEPLRSRRKNFKVKDLANLPLIQTSHGNSLRILLERAAREDGFNLNLVIEAEALAVIKDLVQRGVGYHVSPYSAVAGDLKNGNFSGGPIQDLSISRFLVHRNDRPVSLALSEMIAVLIAQVKKVAAVSGSLIRVSPTLGASGHRHVPVE